MAPLHQLVGSTSYCSWIWFYCSPFDTALVFSIDGVGDGISVLVYKEHRYGDRTILFEQKSPISFGAFYTAFTNFLGFRSIEGEYKVMGMAAYGDPHRFDLSNLFSFSPQAQQLRMQTQLINNSSTSCFESHCNFDFISSIVGIPHAIFWSRLQQYIMIYSFCSRYFYGCLSGPCQTFCLSNPDEYLLIWWLLLTVLRICLYSVIPI